jgi:hypothetical protein
MLESKVVGVRIAAMSTTLPVEQKGGADNAVFYVCDELQTTSDLGFDAAKRLISTLSIVKEDIGILLFGSKTPDYRSPNTAAILQGRLGLAIDCICFDTNVGANGFIKMTQVASSLLANSTKQYALIIIGDTPSKLQNNKAGVKFEVSDASTAVLLQKAAINNAIEFSVYSSGEQYKGSYLKEGGFRDFNANNPYDGSESKNYIVKCEFQDLNRFIEAIRPVVENILKNNEKQLLVHSFILENLKIEDSCKNEHRIKADASELPLLLETMVKQKLLNESFYFISAGEGMALMTMKINHIPEVMPTNHSREFFEDYKVSHEM